MALIKGICKNFGECDLADNKEIQEVDKTNFVCEECGKPLHPVNGSGGRGRKTPGGRSNMKLVCIIAASMIGLVGACIGVYSHLSKSKIDRLIVEKKVVSLHVGQNEIIKVSAVDKDGKEIKDANVIYLWTIADKKVAFVTQEGKISALAVGNTSITVRIKGEEKYLDTCQVEVKDTITADRVTSRPSSSTSGKEEKPSDIKKSDTDKPVKPPVIPAGPKVSWGKYEGPSNGLGGTIKVTRSYSLNLHNDGETLELSPGDEIQQTKFTNGELRGGVWVHDGYRRAFNR